MPQVIYTFNFVDEATKTDQVETLARRFKYQEQIQDPDWEPVAGETPPMIDNPVSKVEHIKDHVDKFLIDNYNRQKSLDLTENVPEQVKQQTQAAVDAGAVASTITEA